jgi:two-component system response regulator (stage 0 sporulation protein F)
LNIGDERYLLIVDDQPAICELLSEVFNDEGFEARTCLNGDQAIQVIKTRKPSLIFMDINMPGKNGLETLREAKHMLNGVPVVMLTAYGELEDVLEARKQGLIRYYITKPFDVMCLIKLTKRIMSQQPECELQASGL